MGMFEKDKLFPPDGRLDEMFPPGAVDKPEGAQFVLWAVEPKGTLTTDIGPAQMTWLQVSTVDKPDQRYTVGTLSEAIAEKAKEAEASDFPAVCRSQTVSTEKGNDAFVIQWIKPFEQGSTSKRGK